MKTSLAIVVAFVVVGASSNARAGQPWTEGKHYFPVASVAGSTLPSGTMEVTEVFSYGCPECAEFNPVARKLQHSLPARAKLVYIPASFVSSEDWPMFQRAYCTAEVLGIADRTHDAMFDAVWKTGELALADPSTRRVKNPLPTIEEAARFYNRHSGVKIEDFLAAAKSFSVDVKMKAADEFIRAYGVNSTPTIVVNRRYRLDAQSAGGYDQLIELVTWLVTKDKK
jgi:thiol:disulfide interchange protein DsbA